EYCRRQVQVLEISSCMQRIQIENIFADSNTCLDRTFLRAKNSEGNIMYAEVRILRNFDPTCSGWNRTFHRCSFCYSEPDKERAFKPFHQLDVPNTLRIRY